MISWGLDCQVVVKVQATFCMKMRFVKNCMSLKVMTDDFLSQSSQGVYLQAETAWLPFHTWPCDTFSRFIGNLVKSVYACARESPPS